MSCIQLSEKHIKSLLITWHFLPCNTSSNTSPSLYGFANGPRRMYDAASYTDALNILADFNAGSWNATYPKAEPATLPDVLEITDAEFINPAFILDPIAAIKAADCLRYNSDNAPNYKTSAAAAILDSIKQAFIRALPGYDKAKWTIK